MGYWRDPYNDDYVSRGDDEPGCPDCGGLCLWRIFDGRTCRLIVPCECMNGSQSCLTIEDLYERCQDMADRFPNSTEIRT